MNIYYQRMVRWFLNRNRSELDIARDWQRLLDQRGDIQRFLVDEDTPFFTVYQLLLAADYSLDIYKGDPTNHELLSLLILRREEPSPKAVAVYNMWRNFAGNLFQIPTETSLLEMIEAQPNG